MSTFEFNSASTVILVNEVNTKFHSPRTSHYILLKCFFFYWQTQHIKMMSAFSI